MFANSKMISGFCVPFFMQEIMGELGTPVIPLSQIIKTTKGTNQFECGAQRHGLSKGLSLFLFLPPTPLTFSFLICSFLLTRGSSQRHLGRQGAELRIQNINSLPPPPRVPITITMTCKMMWVLISEGLDASWDWFSKQKPQLMEKNRTLWLVSLPYFAPSFIVHFPSQNLPGLVLPGSGEWGKAPCPGPCSRLAHSSLGQPGTQQLGTGSQWFM